MPGRSTAVVPPVRSRWSAQRRSHTRASAACGRPASIMWSTTLSSVYSAMLPPSHHGASGLSSRLPGRLRSGQNLRHQIQQQAGELGPRRCVELAAKVLVHHIMQLQAALDDREERQISMRLHRLAACASEIDDLAAQSLMTSVRGTSERGGNTARSLGKRALASGVFSNASPAPSEFSTSSEGSGGPTPACRSSAPTGPFAVMCSRISARSDVG